MTGFNGYDAAKFFEPNLAIDNTSGITASSGTSSEDNIIDPDQTVVWQSVGSDDMTTETITITFSTAITLDRLFFLNINWKEFQVKYNTSNDFSNVKDLDTSGGSAIDVTNYDKDMAYFEFTEVSSVSNIVITVDTTQVADAQKYLGYFIPTVEIGTFSNSAQGKIFFTFDNNQKRAKAINQKFFIQKQQRTARATAIVNNTFVQADYDLIYNLSTRINPFLLWACGGLPDSSFAIRPEGYGLRNVYKMQVNNDFKPAFTVDLYSASISDNLTFLEVN